MPDESYEFVTQQLMIPPSWIHFAQVRPSPSSLEIPLTQTSQATSAKYKGDCFEQYYALLTADEHNLAHPVAVLELAPEAVLRNDMVLLRKLFLPFGDTRTISDWDLGGQVRIVPPAANDELTLRTRFTSITQIASKSSKEDTSRLLEGDSCCSASSILYRRWLREGQVSNSERAYQRCKVA